MDRVVQVLTIAFAFVVMAATGQAQESAAGEAHAAEQAAEREALEPRVSSTELAEGPRSRRSDDSDVAVMDRLDLDRTEVTGNQELPKVLYIVPWQKSDPGDLMGRPVNSLLDEVLAPLDREEFIRQVDYYSDLYGDVSEEE
ncbi:MAG: hypothetical protein WD795_20485 [Woeseia sp.]